jgi:hypothetical protein
MNDKVRSYDDISVSTNENEESSSIALQSLSNNYILHSAFVVFASTRA